MNGFDFVEACIVCCVEGQNSLDAVDEHSRNKPGVMHLGSGDAIVHQQSAPFLVDRRRVGKKPKLGFNIPCSTIRLLRRKPIPISIGWTGQNVPELAEILRGITRNGS